MKKVIVLVMIIGVLCFSFYGTAMAGQVITCPNSSCEYPSAYKWCAGVYDDELEQHEVPGYPGTYCNRLWEWGWTDISCPICYYFEEYSHLHTLDHSSSLCTNEYYCTL